MTSSAGLVVLAVTLVLLSGLFAAADAAISTVSAARIAGMVRAGHGGARQLATVAAERRRHINLLILLRLGSELSATVLVTVVALRWISPAWLALTTAAGAMLVVSYVLVGVGPRTIGRQHSYQIGVLVAGPVRVLGLLLGPLSRLLIVLGNAITPGKGFREGPFTSEVELRELVDLAQERGVVEDSEREMIHSVFELGDTLAREVMVPRTEIVWIERTKTVRQALALSLRTGFSRLPVIGENVDDIVGVVNVKDLVRASMEERGGNTRPVENLMKPASFVPDSKRLDDLLRKMQVTRNHVAIAVDEYGGTAGLLTIEDILEEIVGEITDESDADERPPIEYLKDGAVRVSARLGVDDLGELYGVELEDHDVDTVVGLLAQRLGRVPLPGAEAEVAGLRLHAEGGKDRRGRMRITTVVVNSVRNPSAPPHRNGKGRAAGHNGHDQRTDSDDRSVDHA